MEPETIYVNHEPNTYKAYKTVDGWRVMFLDEHGRARGADGSRLYKHRQNAYAAARRLNKRFAEACANVDEMVKRDGAIIL